MFSLISRGLRFSLVKNFFIISLISSLLFSLIKKGHRDFSSTTEENLQLQYVFLRIVQSCGVATKWEKGEENRSWVFCSCACVGAWVVPNFVKRGDRHEFIVIIWRISTGFTYFSIVHGSKAVQSQAQSQDYRKSRRRRQPIWIVIQRPLRCFNYLLHIRAANCEISLALNGRELIYIIFGISVSGIT